MTRLACADFLTTAGAIFEAACVSMVTGGPPSVAILVSASLVLSSAVAASRSGVVEVTSLGATGVPSAIAARFVSAAGEGASA